MKYLKLTIYLSVFFLTANVAHGAAITWDGGGTTNNWSEAANWSGNVVPGSADDVTFDATSVKDATWDASHGGTVKSLNVAATYSGTLTMGRNVIISGSGGWTYAGSSFNAGTYAITFSGNSTKTFTPGSANYYHIILNQSGYSLSVSGTANVLGDLNLAAFYGINSGTLNVYGNITVSDGSACAGGLNSGIIGIVGNGNQALSQSAGELPNVTINKPSGTLSLSGTVNVCRDWTWTSGKIDAGTSILRHSGSYSPTITPGPWSYYNVEVNKSGFSLTWGGGLKVSNNLTFYNSNNTNFSGYSITTKNFSQTGGTITLSSSVLKVSGNFSRTGGTFNYNTSTVALTGFNQTISGSTTFYRLYKLINQPDTVTFTAGTTTTIATGGVMRFWGKAEGKTLAMRSSAAGSAYTITKTGSAELEYLDIKDASFSAAVTAAASTDSGGNTNVTVTKEFISKIRSSGGDYTTLSAWEAAVQVDLTAATTKVFSHSGLTGSIPDNSAVTGASSGATGTAVHVTSSQILIKTIVGTFQSGEQIYLTQNVNYVVASSAGLGAIATAECYNDWPTGLAEDFLIDGWTTDSTRYVKVYVPKNQRHTGKAMSGSNYTGFAVKATASYRDFLVTRITP